jgi:hypothetical protein
MMYPNLHFSQEAVKRSPINPAKPPTAGFVIHILVESLIYFPEKERRGNLFMQSETG